MYIYVQQELLLLDMRSNKYHFAVSKSLDCRHKPDRFSYMDCGRDYYKRYIEVAVALTYTV